MPFHSGYGYYGTGDWLWSIFSTVLFIVLVTMAVMLLVRLFSGARQGPGSASRPVGGPWFGPGPGGPGAARSRWATPEAEGAERILAERYARGEISEEEYRSRLEVLRQAGQVGGWAQPPTQREPTQQKPAAQGQEPRQESAEQPSAASAGWQQFAEPPVVTSAAHEQRTEEVR